MKKVDLILSYLGFFLFFLGLLAIINSFLSPKIANFLWFCYISLILIGYGIWKRNSFWIVLQLNIIFIPLLFWNLDFFYRLFLGIPLFGITDYLFEGGLNSLGNFITLQHIYILPISLYCIYRFGLFRKDIWKFSFFEVMIIFVLGIIFSFESNPNCAFESCVSFISLTGFSYVTFWIFSMFVMTFGINFLLGKFFLSSSNNS